jgi:hypothetical protein
MKRIYVIAALFSLFFSTTAIAQNSADTFHTFCASRQVDRNLLTWAIDEDVNNSHFEIERSTDGKNWRTIALVLETFDAGKLKQYSFFDEHNEDQVIHYRIRLTDIKGQSYYSSIQTVRRNTKVYRMA